MPIKALLPLEISILGAVLSYPSDCYTLFKDIPPDRFISEEGSKLAKLFQEVFTKHQTLSRKLISTQNGSECPVLDLIPDEVMPVELFEAYKNQYREDVSKHHLSKKLATALALIKTNPEQTSDEILNKVIAELTTGWNKENKSESLYDIIANIQTTPTKKIANLGYPFLDNLIEDGLSPGNLYIIAARPAVGKTTFLLNIAYNASVPTQIFSLEMDGRQLGKKLTALMFGTQSLSFTKSQVQRILETKIFINDASYSTFEDIAGSILFGHYTANIKLVMIDYLQLISLASPQKIRAMELAVVSRKLKLLARRLGIAIVVVSQLNRKITERENQTPQLSDLRDSGAIEQDADVIIFLSEVSSGGTLQDTLKVIVQKNRFGSTGEGGLKFNRKFSKII